MDVEILLARFFNIIPDGKKIEFADKESKKLYKSIYKAASADRKAELKALKKSDVIYNVNINANPTNFQT